MADEIGRGSSEQRASPETASEDRLQRGLSLPEQLVLGVAPLWLLIGPRIALPLGADVRVEDLVFVVIGLVVLRHWRSLGPAASSFAAIGTVAATSLLSAAAAILAARVDAFTSVLFAVRPFEYWLVYPAMVLLLRTAPRTWTRHLEFALAIVTVVNVVFAILQYWFHLPIGFSHQSYERAAGLTAGPYELGAIAAASFVYWMWRRRVLLAVCSAVALILSISRVSLVGAAAGVAILAVAGATRIVAARMDARRRGERRPLRLPLVIAAAVTATLLIAGALIATVTPVSANAAKAIAPITDRFGTTSVLGSWEAAAPLAARIPPVETSTRYRQVAYSEIFQHVDARNAAEVGAEPSNLVRFFRWHLILDTFDSPDRVVLGLGPSFVGGSVDGSYLRFFADGGLLGLGAWVFLVVSWFRRSSSWMAAIAVTFLVGATFIDIVYAERPMVLLWMLLAMARFSVFTDHRATISRLLQRRPRTTQRHQADDAELHILPSDDQSVPSASPVSVLDARPAEEHRVLTSSSTR